MAIYHITYLSDGLRVKGYLGIPHHLPITKSSLAALIDQVYPGRTDLAIHEVAHSDHATEVIQQERPGRQPIPAFIYCRGGIGKVGMVKLDWVKLFTAHRQVVFAPSYRGNEGGEGRDEFGGADVEDVHSAFRLLQQLPFVQPDRVSVMGFSRGAVNAMRTAIEIPGVHRLVLWGGVSDLAATYEQRVDLRRMLKRVIGGTPSKVPEAYELRSAVDRAADIRCPTLIIHGKLDEQVDFSHGQNLYQVMSRLGKNVTLHAYEGYGHHLPSPVHEAVVDRMFDWIQHS